MNDATNHAEAHEVLRREPRVFGDCLDLRRVLFQDRRGAFECDNREVAVRGDPEVPRGGERQRSPEPLSPMTSEATGALRDAMVHKSSEIAVPMLACSAFSSFPAPGVSISVRTGSRSRSSKSRGRLAARNPAALFSAPRWAT